MSKTPVIILPDTKVVAAAVVLALNEAYRLGCSIM